MKNYGLDYFLEIINMTRDLVTIAGDGLTEKVGVHILDSPRFSIGGLGEGDAVPGLTEFYNAMDIKGEAQVLYRLDGESGSSLIIRDSSDSDNHSRAVIYSSEYPSGLPWG